MKDFLQLKPYKLSEKTNRNGDATSFVFFKFATGSQQVQSQLFGFRVLD